MDRNCCPGTKTRAARHLDQRSNLLRRDSDRLLAIDVLAGLQRRDGHLRVKIRRCGNENRIDVFTVQDSPPVGVSCGIVSGSGAGGLIQTVRLDVAQSDDFGVGLQENALEQV